jgi:cytochrome b6-f complex iron-sulfur subunit
MENGKNLSSGAVLHPIKQRVMNRRVFLKEMHKPVLLTCAICMGACTKEDPVPDPGTPPSNSRLTVDLGAELLAIGAFVTGPNVIVVRLAAGNVPSSFVAVQRACTHQGTDVNWNGSTREFVCPNHGARFNTSGVNVGGQSTSALPRYSISIQGNTLTVS